MSGFVRLAALADVAAGTSLLVDHGDRTALLVRLDDGVRAYDARCPHARTELADGPLVDGRFVECPMHGALFAAADGALQPGPVTCAGLTAWPVRVADGHVEVDVPAPEPDPNADRRRPASWGAIGARTAAANPTDH